MTDTDKTLLTLVIIAAMTLLTVMQCQRIRQEGQTDREAIKLLKYRQDNA